MAAPAAIRMDRKVVDISPSTVVSRQNNADEPTVGGGDEAHTRVAVEMRLDALARIRLTESHALARSPQREHFVVVFDCQWGDLEFHFTILLAGVYHSDSPAESLS